MLTEPGCNAVLVPQVYGYRFFGPFKLISFNYKIAELTIQSELLRTAHLRTHRSQGRIIQSSDYSKILTSLHKDPLTNKAYRAFMALSKS